MTEEVLPDKKTEQELYIIRANLYCKVFELVASNNWQAADKAALESVEGFDSVHDVFRTARKEIERLNSVIKEKTDYFFDKTRKLNKELTAIKRKYKFENIRNTCFL